MPEEVVFVSRRQLGEAHLRSLHLYGGSAGVRSEELIESALAAPINDYLYAGAYLFAVAAAYAFHLAQAQGFLDGNKRAAVGAALVFLRANGVPIKAIDSFPLHEDLAAVAERRMTKAQLAERFRQLFGG